MELLNNLGERKLINHIRRIVKEYGKYNLCLDDAACLPYISHGQKIFVTTDPCPIPNLVQFIGMGNYYHAGWLSAVKSISDLAAVGAKPIGLTVSVEFTADTNIDDFDLFFQGFVECAVEHGTILVGGNIKEADSKPNAVSFGIGLLRGKKSLNRGKVEPGDIVYVVEQRDLGSFWAGIAAYLAKDKCIANINQQNLENIFDAAKRPRAKVSEAKLLRIKAAPSFCMDNSDGIFESCKEITTRQKVDVYINFEHVCFSQEVTTIAHACQGDPRVWALAWGGCSLLCVSKRSIFEKAQNLLFNQGIELSAIGEIRKGEGQVLLESNNEIRAIDKVGFFGGEQFRPSSFRLSKQKRFLDMILYSKLEDIIFGNKL